MKRDRELQWWVRLARDHGQRDATPEAIVSRLQARIDRARAMALRKVVGFCAAAKGGDNDVAQYIADKQQLAHVSFGKWLSRRATEENPTYAGANKRRVLQQLGQDIIDDRGELTFCLDVLAGLPASLPEAGFVIDGIRHVRVYESLRFLVGAEHLKLAFVDRPRDVRRRRLIAEEGFTSETVDSVMDDPTEWEVPFLRERWADVELDGGRPVEQEGKRLLDSGLV